MSFSPITDEQVRQFEQAGAVTVDTPFTPEQIAAGAAAFDRLLPLSPPRADGFVEHRVQRTNDFHDAELLEFIQHPFLEAAAKQILRAEEVEFWATAIVKTYPEPGAEFSYWQHVDIKYRTRDLDAVPKRMICGCLLWLTDVTMDRAPLMYSPGSHRMIAAEMDRTPGYIDNPAGMADLPRLDYPEPRPLLVRAGQVTLLTTSVVHGASRNTGAADRKVMFINFVPKGHEVRANMDQVEARNAYLRSLREHFRPERRHILPGA